MQNKVALVSFNTVGDIKNYDGRLYAFNTAKKHLKKGNIVFVDSKGSPRPATFIRYARKDENIQAHKSILGAMFSKNYLFKFYQVIEEKLINFPLNISQSALDKYRTKFKNNEHETEESARKKLTRNIMLSSNFTNPEISENVFIYRYGFQEIYVRGYTIIRVKSVKRDKYSGFEVNENKKAYLNKVMKIEDCVSV